MPRRRNVFKSGSGYSHYHCISRVVDRNFVFGVRERDVFRKILRQVEGFAGVRVLTWTILSNHFHVLVEVPPPPVVALTDAEILDRCRCLYSAEWMEVVEIEFTEAQRVGGEVLAGVRSKYLRRMWDLSEFMKTLKQKFTGWFNREHDRVGTLWESRFKSVIVEGSWKCLIKVAAYIDLNAVRAGLVEDPKDYRWCGYGEAVGGEPGARSGLVLVLADGKPGTRWRDVAPRYRKVLFGIGEERVGRGGISRAEVSRVWRAGGELTAAQLLRCRVRYFSDGLAIGSDAFVERVFRECRSAFSSKRSSGARRMRGGEWDGLRAARDLRVGVVTPSGGDG